MQLDRRPSGAIISFFQRNNRNDTTLTITDNTPRKPHTHRLRLSAKPNDEEPFPQKSLRSKSAHNLRLRLSEANGSESTQLACRAR